MEYILIFISHLREQHRVVTVPRHLSVPWRIEED